MGTRALVGVTVVLLLAGGCTFVRPLDYLSEGSSNPDAGPLPAPDGGGGGQQTDGPMTTTNPVPADVTANAVVVASDVYVAGTHGSHGWVGHFDATSATLLGSVDVDVAGSEGSTSLAAIAASPTGLVVAGSVTHADGSTQGIRGSLGSDLSAPMLHVVPTTLESGAARLDGIGVVNGVTWSAGTVTLTDNSVRGWFAVNDTECPPATPQAGDSADVVRIDLAFVSTAVVAFTTRSDNVVTYGRFAGADCTRTAFPQGGEDNEISIVPSPSVFAAVGNGSNFYGAGTSAAGASTFFITYDQTTGRRPVNGGFTQIANKPSKLIAAAHDGDALFALGTIADAESVLVEGSLGQIPQGSTPAVLAIPSYNARGIAAAPTGNSSFFLVGGTPQSYLLRCDKKTGCPPHP